MQSLVLAAFAALDRRRRRWRRRRWRRWRFNHGRRRRRIGRRRRAVEAELAAKRHAERARLAKERCVKLCGTVVEAVRCTLLHATRRAATLQRRIERHLL